MCVCVCVCVCVCGIQGEFVESCKIGEAQYGLTMSAIEQVAQQGLACVTHMQLQASQHGH